MKRLFLYILILGCLALFSQPNCDSIEKALTQPNLQEATKCKLLIECAACYAEKEPQKALGKYAQAERLALNNSYTSLACKAQYTIAGVYYDQGKIAECKKYAEESVKSSDRDNDDVVGKINSRKMLAKVIFLTGDLKKSVEIIKSAISFAEGGNKLVLSSECELLLANFYISAGKFTEAETIYKNALEKVRGKEDRIESIIRSNLGTLYLKMNNIEAAEKSFNAALDLKRKIGDKKGEFLVMYQRAMLWFGQKKYEESLKTMNSCLELAANINNPIMEGDVYKAKFAIFKQQGDLKSAAKELEKAIERYRNGQEKSELIEAYNSAEKFYTETD